MMSVTYFFSSFSASQCRARQGIKVSVL